MAGFARAVVVMMVVAGVGRAAPNTPSIVDVYNLIDNVHPIKKAGAGWTIDGNIVVTVDLPNAYLTFSDPATKHTTAAALWVASNHRFFFGLTNGTSGMAYYEYDGGNDVPEEVQPSPLPSFSIDDLLMPAADAKLVATSLKAFPNHVTLSYELPRKGTTLVVHVDLAEIRTSVRDAALFDRTKAKLLAIIDNQMYSRFELPFRKETGGFDIGKKSRP